MNGNDSELNRRSTRLSISIPIVLSGTDTEGNEFIESVRTLIINKHGAKILTTRHLTMGSEVMLENRALHVAAKATVAWLGEKHHAGDLHHVGLQLHDAQNVWGIEFPPDDWHSVIGDAPPAAPGNPPATEDAGAVGAETQVSSLAGEEITIRLLQELQESADAHARDFQDRLKQLTHRMGLELEYDLRQRAAAAKEREVGPLLEEIRVLREDLSAAREEIRKLETRILQVKGDLRATTENPPSAPLKDARDQLTTLSNTVVESMNQAAESGLREYRGLLQKENQESAARLRREAEHNSLPSKATSSGS